MQPGWEPRRVARPVARVGMRLISRNRCSESWTIVFWHRCGLVEWRRGWTDLVRSASGSVPAPPGDLRPRSAAPEHAFYHGLVIYFCEKPLSLCSAAQHWWRGGHAGAELLGFGAIFNISVQKTSYLLNPAAVDQLCKDSSIRSGHHPAVLG